MRENEPSPAAVPESEAAAIDYAFWDGPAGFKVIYSLQLFHEIDFVVNEGYRKIPHGGIEVGGLLFGTIDGSNVRIEAFRPIDCEHSSGPSLNLSERDLTELETQLAGAGADKELSRFMPVGWFLAHTRSPLELTEAEAKQFDRFFPQPLQLTVLVKPERFQPTRFGFLVRSQAGDMPREATAHAVILPLPGRSHKPGQLIASIPAPAASTVVKRPPPPAPEPARRTVRDNSDQVDSAAEKKADKSGSPVPLSIWKIPPVPDETPEADSDAQGGLQAHDEHDEEPDTQAGTGYRSPEERAARRQLGRDRVRVIEQAFAGAPVEPPSDQLNSAGHEHLALQTDVHGRAGLPGYSPRSVMPSGYVPTNYLADGIGANAAGYAIPPSRPVDEAVVRRAVLNPTSLTALALAAVLGCVAGYAAYLQLPAPVIPLDVRPMNQAIVVSWPQDQTRNAIYAAIRFNDGAPVPLSAEEKMAGQVSLAAAKDFKVEVMSRNWIRDSRGVVRYVHAVNPTNQPTSTETLP